MIHAFIFRVKHFSVLELLNPENEVAAIFRNTGRYLAVSAALHCLNTWIFSNTTLIIWNLVNVAAFLVFVCSKWKVDVLSTEIVCSLLFRQKNFKSVKYGREWKVKHLQNFNINHRKLDRFSVCVFSSTPTHEPKKAQSHFYVLSVAFLLFWRHR